MGDFVRTVFPVNRVYRISCPCLKLLAPQTFLFSSVHQTHKKRERLKTAGTIDGLVQGLDEEGYVPAPKKRFNS